jgi:hypothetical protein
MADDATVEAMLDPKTRDFFHRAIANLERDGVPFLVGGAYALERYTGLARHTKDFDVFVRPADVRRALDAFAAIGLRTDLTFPHWLGKAFGDGDAFVDVIFRSGNGVAEVDDEWFAHAVPAEVFGASVGLCPPEEVIWQKAYIQERERFDGADVMHLIRARSDRLDWPRLVRRFGDHWRILLAHLITFGFVYPSERDKVPESIVGDLLGRLDSELSSPPPDRRTCQGTLLSRAQYLTDIQGWGFHDARLDRDVHMSEGDIAHWTAAIGKIK